MEIKWVVDRANNKIYISPINRVHSSLFQHVADSVREHRDHDKRTQTDRTLRKHSVYILHSEAGSVEDSNKLFKLILINIKSIWTFDCQL